MSVRNEPLEVIDNGYVYDYVGIGWVKNHIATEVDLINIPTLIDWTMRILLAIAVLLVIVAISIILQINIAIRDYEKRMEDAEDEYNYR